MDYGQSDPEFHNTVGAIIISFLEQRVASSDKIQRNSQNYDVFFKKFPLQARLDPCEDNSQSISDLERTRKVRL